MTTGYSGTPQARKLGIKPGQRIYLDQPPPRWKLSEPPDDVVYAKASGPCDLVISFFTAADQLSGRLPDLTQRIFPEALSGLRGLAGPVATEATLPTASSASMPSLSV